MTSSEGKIPPSCLLSPPCSPPAAELGALPVHSSPQNSSHSVSGLQQERGSTQCRWVDMQTESSRRESFAEVTDPA